MLANEGRLAVSRLDWTLFLFLARTETRRSGKNCRKSKEISREREREEKKNICKKINMFVAAGGAQHEAGVSSIPL